MIEGYPTFEQWSPLDKDGIQHKSVWSFGGYYENMIEMSLRKDDPKGFVHFMRAAGLSNKSETFNCWSMERYCDKHKSVKCKAALSQLEAKAA